MIQLDDKWLAQQGILGLSADDAQSLLQHLYSELELRVGMRLSENLTDQQLAEFEEITNRGDEQAAFVWLETNCPNYKDVVQQELDKLAAELRANKDQILAA
jgi:Protein of unknown function (DUF5663)